MIYYAGKQDENRENIQDHMLAWNMSVEPECILCQQQLESRTIFFLQSLLTKGMVGSDSWSYGHIASEYKALSLEICFSNNLLFDLAWKE